MKTIDHSWIMPLTYGGTFLGSGGGGESLLLQLHLEALLKSGETVSLLDTSEIEENAHYLSLCMMGSTELSDENPMTSAESTNIVKRLSALTGHAYSGIFALEAVALNILYGVIGAVMLGLPLIDGDAMGRAFPELQMTTFHINNIACNPCVFQDNRGNCYELFQDDTFLLELGIRKVLFENGGIGFLAGYENLGRIIKKCLIPGSISFAADIGREILSAKNYQSMLAGIINVSKNSVYGKCIELFKGTVSDIQHVQKLNWNNISLTGIGSYKDHNFSVLVHNENLIAFKDNAIAAMVPDIITFIDLQKLKPILNNEVASGMEIAVIGLPAPLALKTPYALEVVGPQCFGYKTRYRSLEQMNAAYYFG
jgi:DUF917 family protein